MGSLIKELLRLVRSKNGAARGTLISEPKKPRR